ncbi:hypothetical protein [Nocardia arthritidis]|uniref:DUF305 domain-containing protein n=1 Tax=Nocardia arthritidis TaxID=228602 RepID=A0A6G9YHK3_9NOCA|nr:hypothetical protein [Nocardia arthritidis]QIS12785.1 hypothetical protein F5544_24650 [Nocardia arthritidis]
MKNLKALVLVGAAGGLLLVGSGVAAADDHASLLPTDHAGIQQIDDHASLLPGDEVDVQQIDDHASLLPSDL